MANESGIAHRNGVTPEAETVRPYYKAIGNEEAIFKASYRQGLALVLKGPTGCGKTRFVEAMAHDLGRPLITVACHDDLTTADLVGRYLLKGGVTLDAAPGFGLVVSYNPGYQSVLKDLKDSTRQRMVAIEFGFPAPDIEEGIVAHEAGVDGATAAELVRFGQAIRRLETGGLREVASTRVLIAAGRLVAEGLTMREAARAAIAGPLTDDAAVGKGLTEMIEIYLGGVDGSGD